MIMREIAWRPADPLHQQRGPRRPWDIARVLGLHGTTVKRRLAEMRETGLLRGVHVQPAPALVGLHGSEHHFVYKDASTKRAAFEWLSHEPTAWETYGLVGNEAIGVFATPPGVDVHAHAQRVAEQTGATAVRFHHMTDWALDAERLSALDLRILAAYAEDGFRSISEVAAEVGIAAKTVTARMRALARAGAFIVHPYVNYSKMAGGMTVYLNLSLELGAADSAHVEIANRFPLALCRSQRGAENGYVVLQAAGPTDVEEMIRRSQSIPGVKDVDMRIMHDVHHEPDRWKDALLARAEELARAKGVWSAAWRARPASLAR